VWKQQDDARFNGAGYCIMNSFVIISSPHNIQILLQLQPLNMSVCCSFFAAFDPLLAMIRCGDDEDGGSKRGVSFRMSKDSDDSPTKTYKGKGRINVSAKAALDDGTILMAVTRFPLLFFQWPPMRCWRSR